MLYKLWRYQVLLNNVSNVINSVSSTIRLSIIHFQNEVSGVFLVLLVMLTIVFRVQLTSQFTFKTTYIIRWLHSSLIKVLFCLYQVLYDTIQSPP